MEFELCISNVFIVNTNELDSRKGECVFVSLPYVGLIYGRLFGLPKVSNRTMHALNI